MEYWETQVFPKGIANFEAKRGRKEFFSRTIAVRGEEDLTFGQVDLLAWVGTKVMEGSGNGIIVELVSLSKESQIISKEVVGDFGLSIIDLNGIPLKNIHFMVDSSWKKFHAEDEDIGREWDPCLISLEGWKLGV